MSKLELQSPWILYMRKLAKMFERDPEINVICDEESNTIRLLVNNALKAEALTALLPEEKEFGNVVCKITVIPSNKSSVGDLFQRAFTGNAAVTKIERVDDFFEDDGVYVIFDPVVVQFFADDIGDFYGNESTLYEDLAREIFEQTPQVHFCTDLID